MVEDFDDLKKESYRWNCFSKIDTEGLFSLSSFTIGLENIELRDIESIDYEGIYLNLHEEISSDDYFKAKRLLPLIIHEFTHFIDATSTLWGAKHMTLINDGYVATQGREGDLYKCKLLFDHFKRLSFPNYYNVVNKSNGTSIPWKWSLTCGREFGHHGKITDKPILFVRFLTLSDNEIVRKPLSILSLLETTAMAQEFNAKFRLINQLRESREAEAAILERETLEYIYDPELTEYSVCTHLLANTQGCEDVGVSLKSAAMLARIVLNAPDSAFTRMRSNLSAYIKKFRLRNDDEVVRELKRSLKNLNYGALYYLLVILLPKGSVSSARAMQDGIKLSMKYYGIDINDYFRNSDEQFYKLNDALMNSSIPSIVRLSVAGRKNHGVISKYVDSLPMNTLHLPSVYLGDLNQHNFFPLEDSVFKDYNVDIMFDELSVKNKFIIDFGDGCL